jgi:hypothetical protein
MMIRRCRECACEPRIGKSTTPLTESVWCYFAFINQDTDVYQTHVGVGLQHDEDVVRELFLIDNSFCELIGNGICYCVTIHE